jgi:DNA-binding transcriptional MerR regulator
MFLRWLRCLRDTGMPIADMQRFVELLRAGDETRGERIEVLQRHEQRVEEQIALLQEHLLHIRYKIDKYGEVEPAMAVSASA